MTSSCLITVMTVGGDERTAKSSTGKDREFEGWGTDSTQRSRSVLGLAFLKCASADEGGPVLDLERTEDEVGIVR
jgi:hypothetical protein